MFGLIDARACRDLLNQSLMELPNVIRNVLLAHDRGETVNPKSTFLRFPDMEDSRIIGLPASIREPNKINGFKWVSSYPRNTMKGLQRASALLILNDYETGLPIAVIEAGMINAVRTAICSIVAAEALKPECKSAMEISLVGCGFIGSNFVSVARELGWSFEKLHVYDQNPDTIDTFMEKYGNDGYEIIKHDSVASSIGHSETLVFATTAMKPYINDLGLFGHQPLILHVSLRDLAETIIEGAINVLDDIDHCLTAETSVHLTEQKLGHRDFIAGTIADAINGNIETCSQTTIVSPFGMGILDVAVGHHIYLQAQENGLLHVFDDFFGDRSRF